MGISKLKEFDYSNDRLVIADMDQRDSAYIVVVCKKINELIDVINFQLENSTQLKKEFEVRLNEARKEAADAVTKGRGSSESKRSTNKDSVRMRF